MYMNKLMNRSIMSRIGYILGAVVLVAVDAGLKHMAVTRLFGKGLQVFIDGLLAFYYHENTGAAFGIFQNHTEILALVTSVVLVFILWLILSGRIDRPIANFSFMLVLAGGFGNLIDRVTRGYVVDYIYILPFNFPVFNFADICVVVGTGLLLVYAFFMDRKATPKNADTDENVTAS